MYILVLWMVVLYDNVLLSALLAMSFALQVDSLTVYFERFTNGYYDA